MVTGEVRGWPGGELASLGDVLHMGSVAVGPSHQDRYLVLFPSALLLLSVSKRVSAFVYEVSYLIVKNRVIEFSNFLSNCIIFCRVVFH